MAGHEQLQSQGGEYPYSIDEILQFDIMDRYADYSSEHPHIYLFLNKGYYLALGGKSLTESGYFEMSADKREVYDRKATSYSIDKIGLSGIAPLLFPNPEQRFETYIQRYKLKHGDSGLTEREIKKKRGSFKEWDNTRKAIEGWSEKTKRSALYKGIITQMASIEKDEADCIFPLGKGKVGDFDDEIMEKMTLYDEEYKMCREIKGMLLQRR